MKKFLPCIIVCAFFFMSACEDNTMQPPKKQADQLQSPASLEGTVWVHHPDHNLEPNIFNWFNFSFRLENRSNTDIWPDGFNPEITFNKITVTGHDTWTPLESYDYVFTPPYVRIASNGPPESYMTQLNLCAGLTFDNPKCGPNCKATTNGNRKCAITSPYRFLGKVNESRDTMFLHQDAANNSGGMDIVRDVILIRVEKNN